MNTAPVIQPDLISVIIPTHRRYTELRRAVQSSVEQTHPLVEVIVVADGPDDEARQVVAGMGPRVRYLELPRNAGPAAARNLGVKHSCGEWITFLDDDDTMLPDRLARQFRTLDRQHPRCMSACRMLYRHGNREDIWPSRPIGPTEDLGDYLLIRPSLLERPGVLSLQSLVLHHSIVREAPLTNHADHEDWAWLLEAWHYANARVKFVWEPLVTYNIETEGATRSRRVNWQDSMEWALQYRGWLSTRAFNAFLSSKVALKARRAGSWTGLRQIAQVLSHNHASPLDWLFFGGICLLPLAFSHHAWKSSLRSGGTPGPHSGSAPEPAR